MSPDDSKQVVAYLDKIALALEWIAASLVALLAAIVFVGLCTLTAAHGAEIRFVQGEPPLVFHWNVYRHLTPTPVATILPTHLRPATPPSSSFPTPAPSETQRAYIVEVPALPPGVLVVLTAVGLDGQEGLQSNLKLSNANTSTPTGTATSRHTSTPTIEPTGTATPATPAPRRPWLF